MARRPAPSRRPNRTLDQHSHAAEQIRHAADMVVRARHTGLQKARTGAPSQGLLDEIGTTGLRQYGGFVIEEWLSQLWGRKAVWAYREMMDNSPIIGAILYAVEWLARGVEWRVEEGNDSSSAEFVEQCMGDMSHTWQDLVSEALSMLPYGWAWHEIVYKRRQGYQPDRPFNPDQAQTFPGIAGAINTAAQSQEDDRHPATSDFKDGRIGWRKIPIRAQETLLNWVFDGYSGIQAMHQIDWHGGNHFIPIEKSILFRSRARRNNPEGYSVLRTAYLSYYYLKNVQSIEAIGIERDLAGIPMITPPDNVDIWAEGNADVLAKAQEMVQSVRRDDHEGIVMPAGWEFELVSSGGSRQIDTDAVIRRYEQRIATSMLADFILIGQDAVGSFAMVDVKADLFGLALDGILDLICEPLNRYAIPRLLRLNGMDTSDPPRIAHGSAGRINLEKVGNFFNWLSMAGAPIPWSQELLESLFAEAGLPTNFDEQNPPDLDHLKEEEEPEPAPQLPAAPVPKPGEPAPVPAQDPNAPPTSAQTVQKPVTKAEQHRGVMVALYPSADVAQGLSVDGGEDPDELHVTLAYLGHASDIADPATVKQTVAQWAASTPPLAGHISGAGVFLHGPDAPVAYATPDLPGLPAHRQRLVERLDRNGSPASSTHGFTPHITLAYGRGDLPPVKPQPIRFDRASLVLAGERHDFPLAGVAKAAGDSCPNCGADIPSGDGACPACGTPILKAAAPNGKPVNVTPALRQRIGDLAPHLDQSIHRVLTNLGQEASRVYLGLVGRQQTSATMRKAATRRHDDQKMAQQVINGVGVDRYVTQQVGGMLARHTQRVLNDTTQTLSTQLGMGVSIPDPVARQIIAQGGRRVGLMDVGKQAKQSIFNALAEGRANGDGPGVIAKRIEQAVPAGRFTNAGPTYRAKLISRTETAHAQRMSALAAYQASPLITAVELRDGLLPDSDAVCEARDGSIVSFAAAQDIANTTHPLCTLSLNPIVVSPGEVDDSPE